VGFEKACEASDLEGRVFCPRLVSGVLELEPALAGDKVKIGFRTCGAGDSIKPGFRTCEAGEGVKPRVTEGVLPRGNPGLCQISQPNPREWVTDGGRVE
jgi:hypothetical protein